jgi:hypothetical protein
MNSNWTVTVEQDPDSDDLILPLPQDLIESKGWVPGDIITWIDLGDGSWELRRKGD